MQLQGYGFDSQEMHELRSTIDLSFWEKSISILAD